MSITLVFTMSEQEKQLDEPFNEMKASVAVAFGNDELRTEERKQTDKLGCCLGAEPCFYRRKRP